MAIESNQIAQIIMLNGMNWTNSEIASEVGVSESTVSKYVNVVEEESKAEGVDPEGVFMSYYVESIGERFSDSIVSGFY